VGSKKNPIWRVVVADQRSPRDGRFIETIGHYNPQTEPSTIRIDAERLDHWLARGAQATNTVKQLMKAQTKAGGPTPLDAPAATAVADAPEPEAPEAPEAEAQAATPEEAAPAPEAEAEAAPEEPAAEADAGEDEPSS
jgi:small subunit ribosomal protein S16